MTFFSSSFFVFLLIVVVLYYSCGMFFKGTLQKYVLLFASVFFLFSISSTSRNKLALVILYILFITYFGARLIQNIKTGWRKTIVFWSLIIGLVSVLVITKYAYNMLTLVSELFDNPSDFSAWKFGSVVGCSYFILSAVGYLAEVYMGIISAENNASVIFLFVLYFPQLICGPITRFDIMGYQFKMQHDFDFDRLLNALRRMIWGYFKKLVISERFAVATNAVYHNYRSHSGFGILCGTMCYAVQIYADFSGCMDIVLGASELFGISLPENFKAPYLSRSFKEFYQRWHITLGTWFKDFLMYPLQKTQFMQKNNVYLQRILGKKCGKKISFYMSMLVLWIGIGIWHGGNGLYFMVSTIIPFVVLTLSDALNPFFERVNIILHIDIQKDSWKWFQRCRTVLVTCLLFLFICAGGVHNGFEIIKWGIINFASFSTADSWIADVGLSPTDCILMVLGLVVLTISDVLIDKGSSIFELLDKQNTFFRKLVIIEELCLIAFYGMIGQSQFIYFKF